MNEEDVISELVNIDKLTFRRTVKGTRSLANLVEVTY